ncbi:uncharacterized protein LOC143183573 isoform X2 [Calliopsis andreniformis]|uniref:uncharacterized protein LOC143183573 isoform X2 n=1 Tax=Calliopsis andreniformis TaxID=337506 RepID=UPI003FCC6D4C
MESLIRPPEPLSGVGNMSQNWQKWKKDFRIFMKVSNNLKQSKAYLLRSHIGKVGLDAIERVIPEDSKEKDDVNILITKLDAYFDPPKNETVERYNFFTRSKKKGESIESYINDLKQKAITCNFGHITNSLIRDRVIADIKDRNLRKKLFEVENLDISKLILIYHDHIVDIQHKKQIIKNNTTPVNTKVFDNAHHTNLTNNVNTNNNVNPTNILEKNQKSSNTANKKQCWRCHQKHAIRSCPAWGHKCQKCGDRNHFTNCCQKITTNTLRDEMNKFEMKTNTSNFNVDFQENNRQINFVPNYGVEQHGGPSYTGHSYTLNSWSWMKQNSKVSDNIQKSGTSNPMDTVKRENKETLQPKTGSATISATTPTNTGHNINKQDSCKIS